MMTTWKSIIALSVVLTHILLVVGCGKKEEEPVEQKDDIAFLIGAEAKIRNTEIIIEGKSYEVDIVTLPFGMENMTSKPQEVDISQNIQLIHPKMQTQQNAFKLLIPQKKGPYILHLKPKETIAGIELEFVQKPGAPMLDDTILVSVAGGYYTQKVELLRESGSTVDSPEGESPRSKPIPTEAEVKRAIERECNKRFPGWNTIVEIHEIGRYDEKNQFYRVQAYVAVTVPGTLMSLPVKYVKLRQNEDGVWVAEFVETEEEESEKDKQPEKILPSAKPLAGEDVVKQIQDAVKFDLTPSFVFGRFWHHCKLLPWYDFEKMQPYAGYTGGYNFDEGAPFGVNPEYDSDTKGYLVEFGDNWGGKEGGNVQFRKGKVGSCKAIPTFVAEGIQAKVGDKVYIFENGKWTAFQPTNGLEATGYRTYTVQPGDTLFYIAEKELGSGNEWKTILDTNRSILTNPSDLRVGMTLKIPK